MSSFVAELAQQQAAYPRYRNFFINYDQLLREIRAFRERGAGQRAGIDAEFTEHLRLELNRINDVVVLQWEVLNNELKALLRKEGHVVDEESLENIAGEALLMQDFVQTNYRGFREITRECDQQCGTNLSFHFMPRIEAAPFRQWNFDVILAQLGQLYTRLRQQRGAVATGASAPAGAGFVQTYLVPSSSSLRVKVDLIKHLSPGKASAERPDEKHVDKVKEWNRLLHSAVSESFSQPLHHVYFDNAKGQQYAERLRRLIGTVDPTPQAPVFHCQWEGDNNGKKGFELHFDVEPPGGSRVDVHMRQSEVLLLMEGKLDTGTPGRAAMGSVQAAIVNSGLRPSVSASFHRTSFMGSEDCGDARGAVATLDEDIAFLDEVANKGKDWCRAIQEAKAHSQAVEGQAKLPDGVLRIWAPSQKSVAQLLTLIESHGLRQAPGFSKALQGEMMLHPALATPLPPWCRAEGEPMPVALARPPPAALVTQRPEHHVHPHSLRTRARTVIGSPAMATGFIANFLCECWAASAGDERDLKVDLKTPLAIQRTLLRWLRITVILTSLSAYLVSAEDKASQVNGLLLAVAALLFVVWPTLKFWQNSVGLTKAISKQPKVDRTLPMALGLTLSLVLSATLVVDALYRPI